MRIEVEVTSELRKALENVARQRDVTIDHVIRRALRSYLVMGEDDIVDLSLTVSFEPDAIRGHYAGLEEPDRVSGLTDDELRAVGHTAIMLDPVWAAYNTALEEAMNIWAAATGGEVPT